MERVSFSVGKVSFSWAWTRKHSSMKKKAIAQRVI